MAQLTQHFQLHFTSVSWIMNLISNLINQDLTLGFLCDPWISGAEKLLDLLNRSKQGFVHGDHHPGDDQHAHQFCSDLPLQACC